MGAVFGPLARPQYVSRRILRIKNALGVLAYSHGSHALLALCIPGLEKVWTFCPVLGKLFPRLTAEGHRDSKEIYRWKCGLPKEVSAKLAPAG